MAFDDSVDEADMDEKASAGSSDGGDEADAEGLQEVQRVRRDFPETWLWQDLNTGYIHVHCVYWDMP